MAVRAYMQVPNPLPVNVIEKSGEDFPIAWVKDNLRRFGRALLLWNYCQAEHFQMFPK